MSSLPAGWRELMAAARAGSTAARGQLFESHRPYLLTIAATELDRRLQAKADASDLVQETLFEALLAFSRFDGGQPEHLRAWLREILLHNVANVRRRYKGTAKRNVGRERPLPIPWPGAQPGEGLANDDSTPSGQASHREESERLKQALLRMPGHYRNVIVWHLQDSQTFADIGLRLARSADAAKQLWHRALQCLMNELGN
jgi:RNA polymerase sigma-70 factor (ECF subfamily)